MVVEDDLQLQKVLAVRDQLPELKAIVQWSGKPTVSGVLTWDELMDIGRRSDDSALEERLANMAVNQCCMLVYTSGTTGNPKGTCINDESNRIILRRFILLQL